MTFKTLIFGKFWGPEVVGSSSYQKILMRNLLIYIGLHCVRRSLRTITTLATLMLNLQSKILSIAKHIASHLEIDRKRNLTKISRHSGFISVYWTHLKNEVFEINKTGLFMRLQLSRSHFWGHCPYLSFLLTVLLELFLYKKGLNQLFKLSYSLSYISKCSLSWGVPAS